MIQRVQSVYIFLLILINLIIVVSIDSNPNMSLPESYFGFFRPYINDYFFSEIVSGSFSYLLIIICLIEFLFEFPIG